MYRALLIDLSGTLHIGSRAIPRAVESLARLRAAGVPFRICTNTSKESTRVLRNKLLGMGFEIAENEMFTSLQAVRAELIARRVQRPLLLLSESAMEDFSDFRSTGGSANQSSQGHDAVVIGLAPSLMNYEALNAAFRILVAHKDQPSFPSPNVNAPAVVAAPLLATHRARYIRTEDNQLSLGPGAFISGLEESSGTQATVLGKPSRAFLERALRSLESQGVRHDDWSQVAIVGDDVDNDLGGGVIDLGLGRVLVKTGKYLESDEKKPNASGAVVYSSFADLVDAMLG